MWCFFATAYQGYGEHLSWTTRGTTFSSKEARGYCSYNWVPRQEQGEGSWSKGVWSWPGQQRRQRPGLPPLQQCRPPPQGPVQTIHLTFFPMSLVLSDISLVSTAWLSESLMIYHHRCNGSSWWSLVYLSSSCMYTWTVDMYCRFATLVPWICFE